MAKFLLLDVQIVVQVDSPVPLTLKAIVRLRSVDVMGDIGPRWRAGVTNVYSAILEIIMNAKHVPAGRKEVMSGKSKPSGIWPSGSFPNPTR